MKRNTKYLERNMNADYGETIREAVTATVRSHPAYAPIVGRLGEHGLRVEPQFESGDGGRFNDELYHAVRHMQDR